MIHFFFSVSHSPFKRKREREREREREVLTQKGKKNKVVCIETIIKEIRLLK